MNRSICHPRVILLDDSVPKLQLNTEKAQGCYALSKNELIPHSSAHPATAVAP